MHVDRVRRFRFAAAAAPGSSGRRHLGSRLKESRERSTAYNSMRSTRPDNQKWLNQFPSVQGRYEPNLLLLSATAPKHGRSPRINNATNSQSPRREYKV